MKRFAVLLVIIAFTFGCAGPKNVVYTKHKRTHIDLPQGSTVHVKVAGNLNVRYLGCVNYDGLSLGTSNTGYPGINAGTFAASVLVHSVTASAMKNSRKQKLQREADKVLLPYQSALSDFTNSELVAKGIERIEDKDRYQIGIYDEENPAAAQWVLESTPVFFMTQDQSALVLKHIAAIHSKKDPSQVVYENLAEVVSVPYEGENPEACWLEGQGPAIREKSAGLYAESIAVIMEDIFKKQPGQENKEQTFRYYLGKEKNYERGRLVSINCNRMTIRTLRGWLKSIPIIPDEYEEIIPDDCVH